MGHFIAMTPLDIFSLGRPATEAEILAYIEELKIEALRYFPAFDADLQYELLDLTTWFSAMHEPPLPSLAGSAEAYRLLWLRHRYSPICVRVARSAEKLRIRTVVLEFRHRPPPGKVRLEHERTLSSDEATTFRRALDGASFWTTPTEGGSSGLDGASWYLEGARDGQHHIVKRWSPADWDQARFRALCEQMLMLSDAGEEIYPIY